MRKKSRVSDKISNAAILNFTPNILIYFTGIISTDLKMKSYSDRLTGSPGSLDGWNESLAFAITKAYSD